MSPPDSGDPSVADCLSLLDEVPAAAASAPAFRRHWPSISDSLATLSTALSSPAFPPAAPTILPPLAAALTALMSVNGDAGRHLGHLHTVSLLSTSAATLAQLAADARLLAAPPAISGGGSSGVGDGVISRLRLGSAASRAAALEDLAGVLSTATLPPSSAAVAVSAVASLLDSGDLLPSSRDRAVAVLAALASSDPTCRHLAHESATLLPHLCRALESGAAAEHACLALLPLTSSSRDAAAAVATRGGVSPLLAACASGTPAAQAAAAGVLRHLAAFPDLLPHFRDEQDHAVPLLLQLVALGTPRAQEMAFGCLRNLTASDADEGQRLKVEAFQEGALACVKDFLLDHGDDDGPGRAPALGLLRNLASFRYVAEIAASAGFLPLVAAALSTSDRSATRADAALALAELCCHVSGKVKREVGEAVVPRLLWMLEAKPAAERDAAARALAALLTASGGWRKVFRKDERGVVNVVKLLDPAVDGVDRRFPVAALLAVAQSRRCRKQMVAAGACGFLQSLVDAEVEGAKKLAECLGKGKMLGVFPRT